MDDKPLATFEVSNDCLIAEVDGVRAELRGPEVAALRFRLADYAINLIRETHENKRRLAEMRRYEELAQVEADPRQYAGDAAAINRAPRGLGYIASREGISRY